MGIENDNRNAPPPQGPPLQVIVNTWRKPPARENQHFRPRVVRKWILQVSIDQIARQEGWRPSDIERILWEELVLPLMPAPARKKAA